MKMTVETIFLDAGGVLVHPNWRRVAGMLERHGITVRPEKLHAADAHARFAIDVPSVASSARDDSARARLYFERVMRHAGVEAELDTLAGAWADFQIEHTRSNLWEIVQSDVASALARLRGLGRKLVVVSNSNGTLRGHLDRLGLGDSIDLVVDSHEEGVEKPDPRLFFAALARAAASPATTVHVGDLYEVDVMGARAAGVRALLFDPEGLHAVRDCARITSLAQLASLVEDGAL